MSLVDWEWWGMKHAGLLEVPMECAVCGRGLGDASLCTCPSELGLCLLLLPASSHAVSLTFSVGLIVPCSL